VGRWDELAAVPSEAKGFHFFLGDEAAPLLSAFCASPWSRTVDTLEIGCSSFGTCPGLDYQACITALSGMVFPALERLGISVWELFENSHCCFRQLGAISPLLGHCPSLRSLHVAGAFTLQTPFAHAGLEELGLELDDPVTAELNATFATSR
jgi:hypothetical protein